MKHTPGFEQLPPIMNTLSCPVWYHQLLHAPLHLRRSNIFQTTEAFETQQLKYWQYSHVDGGTVGLETLVEFSLNIYFIVHYKWIKPFKKWPEPSPSGEIWLQCTIGSSSLDWGKVERMDDWCLYIIYSVNPWELCTVPICKDVFLVSYSIQYM